MNSGNEEVQNLANWWSLFAPPLRPSLEEIEKYESQLNKIVARQGMVMGSTPELVDLMLRQGGLNLRIMDNFEPAVNAMRLLGKSDWTDVSIIMSDWLKRVDTLKNSLDIICGDNPFLFLKYLDEWQKLIEMLNFYLKPGGRIIMRGFFKPAELFDFDPYFEACQARIKEIDQSPLSDESVDEFKKEISSIRLATAVVATGPMGCIERKSRNQRILAVKNELIQMFKHPKLQAIIEAILYLETGAEGEFIPQSIPEWSNVKKLIEKAGFHVDGESVIRNVSLPGVIRFFSGVKR